MAGLRSWLRKRVTPLRLGLYIHIPFCVDRCGYCDFVTVRYRAEWRRPYLQALVRELDGWRDILGPVTVASVYFGGGTPSLLRPAEIAALLDRIQMRWHLAPHLEVTLEATPGTLHPRRLAHLLAAGVNRISVGIQTLDDRLLRWLGRRHDVAMAHAVARSLADAGVVWNVDFLAGVPGETEEAQRDILAFVDTYRPHHVSLYVLEVHPETPLGRAVRSGVVDLPDPRRVQTQWLALHRGLEDRGYRFYELSNAARRGYRSRHNLRYWRMQPYLGLGIAAHSCIGPWRWSNPVQWHAYRTGPPPARDPEYRPPRERWREKILLGLRLRRGVPLAWLDRYHVDGRWRQGLDLARELKWVRCENGRIRATPRGWFRLLRLYDLLGLGPGEGGPS